VTRLPVLYEDNHLLVVNKPSGLISMGAASGTETAVTLAAAYLKERYHKPGNVFVGVVSRLDRLVSGVLVLARTSKAASRLSEQFREQTTEKRYLAWVEGTLDAPEWLELRDWLRKDEAGQRMQIVRAGARGAQEAALRVRTVAGQPKRTLVAIDLLSGRKHQIRLQLAAHGHAILGDQKYGAQAGFPCGIGLHCEQLSLEHPTRRERMTFTAPVPDYWPTAR
jgi:23S rRNA pseudouridine1911/1915/1917 synthase